MLCFDCKLLEAYCYYLTINSCKTQLISLEWDWLLRRYTKIIVYPKKMGGGTFFIEGINRDWWKSNLFKVQCLDHCTFLKKKTITFRSHMWNYFLFLYSHIKLHEFNVSFDPCICCFRHRFANCALSSPLRYQVQRRAPEYLPPLLQSAVLPEVFKL